MKDYINEIVKLLEASPFVMFGYLFGSRSLNANGPGSDWDIALYFREYPAKNNPWLRFTIQAELSAILKTDAVDIIILNNLQQPSFAFDIINEGTILVDKKPSERILFEAKVLNRYFDWQYFLKRHLQVNKREKI